MMNTHFGKVANSGLSARPQNNGTSAITDSHSLPAIQENTNTLDPVSGFQLSDSESKRILPHFGMILSGKPGSGKTTMVKKLIESPDLYKDKFDRILVISPSLGKMGFQVPPDFSNNEFDLEWIFDRIHEFNVLQERKLMDYLRQQDAEGIVQNMQNKRRIQELLEETIQTQRILDLPRLQRVIMGFNTSFRTLGGNLGPILGHLQGQQVPKPKGTVSFDHVPSCFLDGGAQSGDGGKGEPSLKKLMLQGLITRRQMVNQCSEKVNEIAEYSNSVQSLYLNMLEDQETLMQSHMNVLLVLDDVAGDIKAGEFDPSLIKLFFNRRHLISNGTLSVITVTQKFTAIPQKIRTSSSWLIIFRLNPVEMENVWKDAVVLDRRHWQEIIDRIFGGDSQVVMGNSLTNGGDRRYDNLGVWTEFPDVFFSNFKLIQ